MGLTLVKNIFKIIVPTFLLFFQSNTCIAHEFGGHNRELENILFGYNFSKVSEKGKVHFRLLCEAAYLTLDYTNKDNGNRFAWDLKQNGVEHVPSLSDISFPSNQYHQMYTHYGWDKGYKGVCDKANWKLRKQLLLSTVKKIGDFKENEKIKLDAFAAIVYEIHILGDHIGDTENTKHTRLRLVSEPDYRGQDVSPTSDGPFNNPTLYTYLLYHSQRLFRDQKNSYAYQQIVGFLNRHKHEYANFPQKNVPYEDINFLAKKTRDELTKYLPKLLENEAFYKRAFLH